MCRPAPKFHRVHLSRRRRRHRSHRSGAPKICDWLDELPVKSPAPAWRILERKLICRSTTRHGVRADERFGACESDRGRLRTIAKRNGGTCVPPFRIEAWFEELAEQAEHGLAR